MKEVKEIEKSIIKTYRKEIWQRFIKAIKEYDLINDNDKIMVCISGGKDSFLMAKCFQELLKHGKLHFEVYYVVMNPGYNEKNVEVIKKNAEHLNIPIEIFETDIFDSVAAINSKSSCYLCARMRRGHLYNKAQQLGCNKIALAHHFDDVIETLLLSMFYASEIKTMLPKLHSDNFKGIDLIRPMYLIKESSIINWQKYNELSFINCACRFVDQDSLDEKNSKRGEIKRIISDLRTINKDIDYNIFKSMDNINLNCMLGYRIDGEYKSFLDSF